MSRIWTITLVALLVVGAAQAQAPVPTLTETQKLQVQVLTQRIELAQLRAQQAQTDFDRARTEIGALLQALTRDGFDLDVQRLVYVVKPPTPQVDR